MNRALLDCIAPVTSRLRRVRFWRVIAIVAIIASAYAFAVQRIIDFRPLAPDRVSGWPLVLSVVVGFVVASIVAWILCWRSFRNPREVATRIEARFPTLQQRLLTAVGLRDDELGYLRQRVIKEARDHSRLNRWTETVSTSQIFWSRLGGIGGVALLAFVLGRIAIIHPDVDTMAIHPNQLGFDVLIEPGNAEVERGTSLIVTARFDDSEVPASAKLVCVNEQGDERMIKMTRNLSDPVIGGFLSVVKERFRYKVIAPTWESETFTVDVFDYPALVRSDANLEYPKYTGLDENRIEDTVRISAIEGTKVTWLCFLNKEVKKAELVRKDGTRMELQPDRETAGALSAIFDLQQTQRLTLELIDNQGRKNRFPPELIARVLRNQPPQLKLTTFGDASVSPLEELPLEAEVSDDVGVSKAGLSYSLDGAASKEIRLDSSSSRGATSRLQHLVELEQLDAKPDQLFSYHFWAEDIGPNGRMRRTQSDMFFAEVRPFEQIFREGQPPPSGDSQPQGQNSQEAQQLADLQKEIINATWRVIREEVSEDRSKEFDKNIRLLIESQTAALETLNALSEKVRDEKSKLLIETVRNRMETSITQLRLSRDESTTPPLSVALRAEQAAYAGLLKLRAREFTVSKGQRSQGNPGNASKHSLQQQLNDLELKQDENRYESERKARDASQQEQEQGETRQILNRLRDLARRQEDLNKEISELQNALEQADTEVEREEVERRLKRLREQQQDLLRETDELSERMQQPENQQRMREANEQLQETRENVQKTTEALKQKDTAQALTAGRRAERQFKEMRDEFRKQTSGQFDQTVKEMRRDARKLDQQEDQLAEKLRELDDPKRKTGLRGDDQSGPIQDDIEKQRKRLRALQERMQETVKQAETSEPLLAQKLYDSFRRTQQQQVDRQLSNTSELLRRGFEPQAREMERLAGEQIDQLREALEEAATSVLGDETKSLERALGELEQLERELTEEIQSNLPREGGASPEPTDREGGASPEPTSSDDNVQRAADILDRIAGDGRSAAPLGGDDFRQWSDRLRDVEEMVDDPELRNQAAQIRDRAREVRRNLHRNNEAPQWSMVEKMIAVPLRELKQRVSEELLRLSADRNATVPIDRDPVPAEFSDAVRRYYESLGGGR